MAANNVANVRPVSGVHGVEEYHTPEGVQQDHAQCLGGAGQKEDVRSTVKAHRGGSDLNARKKM